MYSFAGLAANDEDAHVEMDADDASNDVDAHVEMDPTDETITLNLIPGEVTHGKATMPHPNPDDGNPVAFLIMVRKSLCLRACMHVFSIHHDDSPVMDDAAAS